jgi:tetratricopeptide (TPR) repeat protein
LRLAVCDDTGFRLYLATFDRPERRDALIARVIEDAAAEKVKVTRLDVGDAEPEASLVGLLRAHVRETDLPPGSRQAVMVTGIEQRLDYARGREGFTFLYQANLLRDALPEAAPVPVVLWLSRMASAALPPEAPDLWHWRAANFDFTGDEAPRVELLRELTTLRPEDDLAMSGEQREARVAMLADLLAELEREGSPKSKRQTAERAGLLSEMGTESWRLGRAAEALPLFEQALDLYRKIGDRRGEGSVLGNLGNAWLTLGEPRRAVEYYEQALAIAREIGDRRGEGVALGNLGTTWGQLGEPRRASGYYKQQLKIAREIGDRMGEANALGGLGIACFGEPRRAIEYHEQALRIAQEIGYRMGEGNALGNLGIVWVALGEPRRGIKYYEQQLVITREIGDRMGEGNALGNLGNACYLLGEARRAIQFHEQHLEVRREIGDRRGEGHALFNSALALYQLGERAEAVRRAREALEIFEAIGAKHLVENVRAQLAEWGVADEGS